MPQIGPQSALRPRPLLGSAGFRRPCPPQKDPSDRIADLHAFALAGPPGPFPDKMAVTARQISLHRGTPDLDHLECLARHAGTLASGRSWCVGTGVAGTQSARP